MTKKRNITATDEPSTPLNKKARPMSTLETPASPVADSDTSVSELFANQQSLKKEEPEKKHKPTSKAPTIDNTYDRVVNIQVGEDPKFYGIHEGVLRKCSPQLGSILTSTTDTETPNLTYKPATTLLTLPNDDSNTYIRFQRYLYSDSLLLDNEDFSSLPWTTLLDVYLFGIKFSIVTLQNKCIDTAINKNKADNKLPNADGLTKLWRTEAKAKPMRSLLLELYARKCDLKAAMAAPGGRWPMPFMKALVGEMYTVGKEKEEGKEERVRWWGRRREWYVSDQANPFAVDD